MRGCFPGSLDDRAPGEHWSILAFASGRVPPEPPVRNTHKIGVIITGAGPIRESFGFALEGIKSMSHPNSFRIGGERQQRANASRWRQPKIDHLKRCKTV
jgi:hypothetical protein